MSFGIGGSSSSSTSINVNQNKSGATQGANSPVYNGNVNIQDAHIQDALNALQDLANNSIAAVGSVSRDNSDILAQVTAAAQAAAKNTQSNGQSDNNATFVTIVEIAAVALVAVIVGAIWLFTRKHSH